MLQCDLNYTLLYLELQQVTFDSEALRYAVVNS
jgi:hypothetical protein